MTPPFRAGARLNLLSTFGIRIMELKYFQDTDTLPVNFSDRQIVETRDINEVVLIELDADGRIVSVTIEHAGEYISVSSLSYETLPA